MHWLFLLLALAALVLAFNTAHIGVLVLSLLAALLLLLAWARGWYASRIGNLQHDLGAMVNSTELHRVREFVLASPAGQDTTRHSGEANRDTQ